MRSLPLLAIIIGIAGLSPFIGASIGALGFTDEWQRLCLLGLAAYGAVILAFLGGVHWGIALEACTGQTVAEQRARYALGVVPSLIGWAALLVVFTGLPKTGLLLLTAGFIGTVIAEARATRLGRLPQSYMMLRWVLSIVVIVCLVSVCLVLTLGGRITL